MKYRTKSWSYTAQTTFLTAAVFFAGSITALGQTNDSVAPLKMNVLYIGVDNPVSVAASAATDDKVTVSVVGGGAAVSKTGAGRYNIRVTTATDDCTVNVYVDGKLQGSSQFRVRQLPLPSGTIGGYLSGAYISADVIRAQPGLGLYLQNSPFETKYEVTGFSVMLTDDKGNLRSAECQGSLFSTRAREYLDQYVKSGDIVTIENIRVRAPDGKDLKLPSVLYNIK